MMRTSVLLLKGSHLGFCCCHLIGFKRVLDLCAALWTHRGPIVHSFDLHSRVQERQGDIY